LIRLFGTTGKEAYPEEPAAAQQSLVEKPMLPPPLAEGAESVFRYPSMRQVGFVRKPAVTPVGRIFSLEGGKSVIGSGDMVWVKPLQSASWTEGDRFTVWRPEGSVRNPYEQGERTKMGVQHLIVGEVMVIEAHPDVLVTIVDEAYRQIEIGDLLMPHRNLPPDLIPTKPGKDGVGGHVVLCEEKIKDMGDGDVVFLDRGKDDGLETGQLYTLFIPEKRAEKDDTPRIPARDAGEIMVLLTEADTATALITRAFTSVSPGAGFRSE
jgi:hypothetical protein